MADHVHVSERVPTGPWVLCGETSAVEWQRATGDEVPATWDEACALRKTHGGSCAVGGVTAATLRGAIQKRYKRIVAPPVQGFATLWAGLSPFHAAVVLGSMASMSAHWRRWDPPFKGLHAVFVMRLDAQERVWWCDPLAPKGSYGGEWMPTVDLARFVNGWTAAQHLVGLMPGSSGGGTDLPLLAMKPVEQLLGTATVNATGTSYIFADGTRLVIAGGTIRNVMGISKLEQPIDNRPGDRQTLLLVSAPGAPGWGFLLADDTDWPAGKVPASDTLAARRAEYDLILAGLGVPPRP